uniref:Uncharacterized protein n=1 Tax=Naja naja TaxID=35670 RepID=A0A8C6Y8I3_NAJNA
MRFPLSWSWCTVTSFLILQVIPTKALSHATCNPNSTLLDVGVLPAFFQPLLPPEGLLGLWVKVKPSNPDRRLQGPPPLLSSSLFVVLFRQRNCSFSKKILHAQQVGSHAALVHNVSSQMLENLLSDNYSSYILASYVLDSSPLIISVAALFLESQHLFLRRGDQNWMQIFQVWPYLQGLIKWYRHFRRS